ncbi:MAG: hypothetical protein ACRBN8_39890 [Nannocystales bacterium]
MRLIVSLGLLAVVACGADKPETPASAAHPSESWAVERAQVRFGNRPLEVGFEPPAPEKSSKFRARLQLLLGSAPK